MRRIDTLISVFLLIGTPISSLVAIGQNVSANPTSQQCKGVVTEADGTPVTGASVVVKGTKNAAITDIDGRFSLSGIASGSVLTISYLT